MGDRGSTGHDADGRKWLKSDCSCGRKVAREPSPRSETQHFAGVSRDNAFLVSRHDEALDLGAVATDDAPPFGIAIGLEVQPQPAATGRDLGAYRRIDFADTRGVDVTI